MARYEKRGDKVRATVCVAYQRVSATFASQKEAETWAKIQEGQLLSGAKKNKGNKTLADVLRRFEQEVLPNRKSTRPEAVRIAWALANLPFVNMPLKKIGAHHFYEWMETRRQSVAADTINRDLNFYSTLFKWAIRWQWTEVNPVRDLERPGNALPRYRRIDQSEIEALLTALDYRVGGAGTTRKAQLAILLLLALETGMRATEIVTLSWDRVFANHVHLNKTKNGKPRDVPLSQAAKDLLAALPRSEGVPCFSLLNEKTRDSLFRYYKKKAGVKNLHFHDSRHESATQLAKKLPVLALAKMLGHSDINSLMIYYNPTPEEMAALL